MCTPLARSCRALYTLAAGGFAGSWPRELQCEWHGEARG
jgi:hypothetical protein